MSNTELLFSEIMELPPRLSKGFIGKALLRFLVIFPCPYSCVFVCTEMESTTVD